MQVRAEEQEDMDKMNIALMGQRQTRLHNTLKGGAVDDLEQSSVMYDASTYRSNGKDSPGRDSIQ